MVVAVHLSTMSDKKLQQEIERALRRDKRLSADNIDVSVRAGRVLLRGQTSSFQRKAAMRELVNSFPEVRDVSDQTEIHYAQVIPDADLEDRVRHALEAHDRVSGKTILVSARSGCITLNGEVGTADERLSAENAAMAVPGVQFVENLLVVDWINRSGDEALASLIRSEIVAHHDLRDEPLRVAISGNTVRLSGTVDAHWKKRAAGLVATRFRGLAVENHIVVSDD